MLFVVGVATPLTATDGAAGDGAFLSLAAVTVAGRDWRFGERFSVEVMSEGPTDCDLAKLFNLFYLKINN